ncbi:hypothetical protein HAX54_038803 [Datura stramonium]|uniref:C3H1-type domain-containing protein n=1 Tax=Datura stramonium TaxID=4076 RepID=A0ABS8VK91_DATST|nr:hypothetical protein [Datura stramonium]
MINGVVSDSRRTGEVNVSMVWTLEKSLSLESMIWGRISIDCKHFDFGNGTCPFGTSCFYKINTVMVIWRKWYYAILVLKMEAQ